MHTLIFRLPDYLVQDENYLVISRPKKPRTVTHRVWIAAILDELVDEYGADDPEDFEYVGTIEKEVEVLLAQVAS